jgi:OOP family OmpA-OmpF porin
MKRINISFVAILAMSTFAIAGGDIIVPVQPITPFDTGASIVVDDNGDDNSGFYVGVGYSFLNVERTTSPYGTGNTFYEGTGEYESVMLQAGYKVNQYFGVEGRYWAGIDEQKWSTVTDNRVQSTGGINSYGLYAKPMYPMTEELDVYGLLGYGSVDYDISYDYKGVFDGFSWGFGASYAFENNVAIFADYTSIYNDTTEGPMSYLDDSMDFINVGVGYEF